MISIWDIIAYKCPMFRNMSVPGILLMARFYPNIAQFLSVLGYPNGDFWDKSIGRDFP